jgi:hypothetical protein
MTQQTKLLQKKETLQDNSPRFAFSLGHCLFILLYCGGKEKHQIKDDSKMKRQTNLDRRSPGQIPIICHLLDPPSFSLATTFKS